MLLALAMTTVMTKTKTQKMPFDSRRAKIKTLADATKVLDDKSETSLTEFEADMIEWGTDRNDLAREFQCALMANERVKFLAWVQRFSENLH